MKNLGKSLRFRYYHFSYIVYRRRVCTSYPSLDRPELDTQILTCLVGRGSPTQLPEGIRYWAYQLYEDPPVKGSRPHAIIKATLNSLQTTADPVY